MSNTPRGRSYQDPLYDTIEAKLEREFRLPSGGMSAIRTKGEKSDSDQVSPVGARSVYQIMPATRRLFLNKYGVDAYSSPEAASRVAALHLRESMDRNGGSWADAVGEYHGGTDRRAWGPINRAYRERVSGAPAAVPKYSTEAGGTTVTTTNLRDIPFSEMFHSTPDELFSGTRRPLAAVRTPKVDTPSTTDILTGGDGIATAPVSDAAANQTDVTQTAGWKAETTARAADTHGDRFAAGMQETLLGRAIATITAPDHEFDPVFMRNYRDNWQTIESFAKTDEEVEQLREATSTEHLGHIQRTITENRERTAIIEAADHPTLLRLGTGIIDPVGWAAGAGVGKGIQLAGVGSRALALASRPWAAVASAAGEGAVGNVAVTAGLDAMGDYVTPSEYATSALMGLGMGAVMGGAVVGMTARTAPGREVLEASVARREMREQLVREVEQDLGPAATPEAVTEAVEARVAQEYRDVLDFALAEVPADQRIMVAEEILTQNEAFKQSLIDKADLDSVSDVTERAMVAETVARTTILADSIGIDKKALDTILARVGQESTAGRLLLSESPVARAVGLTLLENAQGAGGRRRTAAMALAQRERIYNETFSGYDEAANLFRKQEGVSRAKDFWDGEARNAFNRRVFAELERRGTTGHVPDVSPQVTQGADLFEKGMELMRLEQQRVGTVGAARLGDSSIGYVPHRLDPRKVLGLTTTQSKRVRGILAGQFREIEGFDAEFADKLAAKYMERAVDSAAGRYHVPFNLHSPEAGQIVRDALEAMNIPKDDLEKLMGKFSRGGASHTKKRLRLDLAADIGDDMQLMDLFVTDIATLYRSYARRVAGEVALAQYGVMGKKGLTILSKAMTATGATPADIRAFDQVSAEFLNTPFGDANHAWMDNARLATSAARLGGMGFTQLAEFGNAIPSLGVTGMLRGIGSLPRMIKEIREHVSGGAAVNPVLKDIDLMNGFVGADDYHLTRMFDVRDNDIELYNGESLGVISRTLRAGAHANMILSGHRMILSGQIRGMSEQIVRKAVKFARSGAADTALDDMGISPTIRAALRKDMDLIADFDASGELTRLDLFKGKAMTPQMVSELAQAIERGAGQIIQRTYVGETGAWAHSGFLKLLFQFRTFSLTAVEKQWGRNQMNYGAMKSFMYLTAAASFAVPIHMARTQLKAAALSGKEQKEYLDNNLNPMALSRASLNYASSAGLLGDIMDVGAGFASNYGGDFGDKFGDAYGVRGGGTKLVGGVVAPSMGLANDTYAAIMGDPKRLVRSLPGSNLPYVSPFVAAGLAAMKED